MAQKTSWFERLRLKTLSEYVNPDTLSTEEYFRRADQTNCTNSYFDGNGTERWIHNNKPVKISDQRKIE